MNTRIRQGFTLIELLVTVAVIAVLVAMMVPNLVRAKAKARTVICAANLRALGVATLLYLEDNDGKYFRYYSSTSESDTMGRGRLWWFGFEPNGPGSTPNRPLDKTMSPLARYTADLSVKLQCPDFPFNDALYVAKFNQRAATYGYNWNLGPVLPTAANPTRSNSRARLSGRTMSVFAFADGVHFDSNLSFHDAFYIEYENPLTLSGYSHFRHQMQSQYVLLDGHVELQRLSGQTYRLVSGAPAGNLSSSGSSIYGN